MVACRLLNVSRSGFYEWNNRPPSARDQDNELLLKHIEKVHADSRGSYGSPRVHAELTLGLGLVVNEKRVARSCARPASAACTYADAAAARCATGRGVGR